MRPLCVVDLDGTLLDCSERHYRCYHAATSRVERRPWSLPDYWRMKREGRSLSRILDCDDPALLNGFREYWRECIESDAMLRLDRLHEGVIETLAGWRARGLLVLCTLRRDARALHRQLRALGLLGLFDQVIVARGADKAGVLGLELAFGYSQFTWVGDSEADLQAARAYRARLCLVTNGIRDAKTLRGKGAAPGELYPSLNSIDPFFIRWDTPPAHAPLHSMHGAPI